MVVSERLFGPSILFHDLSFFLGCEIVLNVEELADLLDALTLDHGGDLGARELKQGFNIEVIGGHDNFEEHFLVDIDEVGVPSINHL